MTPKYYIDVKSDGTWLIIETAEASALICLENTTRNTTVLKAIRILGEYLSAQKQESR